MKELKKAHNKDGAAKKKKALTKAEQEETGISCTVVIDGYTDFVFVNRFGHTQRQGTLNKALKRMIRDCNYEVLDKKDGKKEVVTLPNFTNHSPPYIYNTYV